MTQSQLTKNQKKTFRADYINEEGEPETIIATVRHDDDCGNGHNTFSITATIYGPRRYSGEPTIKHEPTGKTLWAFSGGCCHEAIAQRIPELAPLIKWHLCSTDGPMHYVANTLHFASDRDCWGYRAGEPCEWEYGVRFNHVPITIRVRKKFWEFLKERDGSGEFQVVPIAREDRPGEHKYDPHYTFVGFADKWHECPFRDKTEAEEFAAAMNTSEVVFVQVPTNWSKGKARELESARRAAIWPEATDEELLAPDLKERLIARLPALLDEFRAAVESLGLVY